MAVNFDYLKSIAPDLYNLFSHEKLKDPLITSVSQLSTKNDLPNLRVSTKDREMTLHSNYNPQREAEKCYRNMKFSKRKLTVAFGFGLGYHLDHFIEQHPDCSILVIEPTYICLHQAVRMRDLSHIFKNPKVKLLVSLDPQELTEWLCRLYSFDQYDGLQFLELPSYSQLFLNHYNSIKKTFFQVFSKHVSNVVTVMQSGDDYTVNCMKNIRHLEQYPWASALFGKFHKVPAVVISAGPALHLQFDRLRALKEQAVLIAVDTAYPILKKQGIQPHFICTADPTPGNFIHLKESDLSDVFTIVEPMTYHRTFEVDGLKAFIANFDGYYSRYLAEFAANDDKLVSWGSIASTCFDLARKIGADPIVFVGQDFAYSDLLTHCPGSRFDDMYYDQIRRNPVMGLYTSYHTFHIQRILQKPVKPVEDIYGNTVYTQHNLTVYANWFHEQFALSPQTIINATERGILKENCLIMNFQDVIDKYFTKSYPIREQIESIYNMPNRYNFEALKKDIKIKFQSLKAAEKQARSLQESVKAFKEMGENSEEEIQGLQEIGVLFNKLQTSAGCGITDPMTQGWVEHENQKAEMFFKREFGRMTGRKMDKKMLLECSEMLHQLYESKITTFQKLIDLFSTALEGIQ
jgi:hypothetical protein